MGVYRDGTHELVLKAEFQVRLQKRQKHSAERPIDMDVGFKIVVLLELQEFRIDRGNLIHAPHRNGAGVQNQEKSLETVVTVPLDLVRYDLRREFAILVGR